MVRENQAQRKPLKHMAEWNGDVLHQYLLFCIAQSRAGMERQSQCQLS